MAEGVGGGIGGGRLLVGRRSECDVLDHLLAEARSGRSQVLVLGGEPGVGKTALLEYLVGSADGFRVARAVGVQSEVELAFAALQQLCAPMLDGLDGLPEPQRDALGAALGLSAGNAPERFLVGLAALSLLSAAAERQPLLCVVDDAQWLDRPSAQALAFVARRLMADPVALVFASREPSEDLAGLPELGVGGLADKDARELLAAAVKAPLDERVRDRIVAEAGGNPLALLELPRGLSPGELAVGFGPTRSIPLSGRIEESYRRRVEDLPADTQQLLHVAAADQLGDPITVWMAADRLGVPRDAAAPAAEAGLLDTVPAFRFHHPLVRSAVYDAASVAQRRAAHRALAEVIDPETDPDRRAWHLAAATTGPDEEIAGELERSAGRAQVRGGMAAAAAFLERSAELTPDRERQATRLLMAARAHLIAGAHERAEDLLSSASRHLPDPGARAQAMRMEGAIRFADGRGGDTPSLLFDAAMALRDLDVPLARETLFEAFEAAMWAGHLTTGTTMFDVARAARNLPPPEGHTATVSLLLSGYTERLTASYADGVDSWRRAAEAVADDARGEPRLQWWHGMAWNATGELFDFPSHLAIARLRARLAREEGALVTLPVALSCLAWSEMLSGRVDVGESLVTEAIDIAESAGIPSMPGAQDLMRLGMLVWRGHDTEAGPFADAVIAEAGMRSQGLAAVLARYCLMILELGHARYGAARSHALAVYEDDPLYIGSIALADIVEATLRSDDRATAAAAAERLSERALASGMPWGLGLMARARALLATDAEAESLYLEAIAQLERSGVVTDLARAHLLYGEWLRRRRRRKDAREALRTAHTMLQATGGSAFANRASIELLATGERARERTDASRDELTPQERQVAELAADGDSNAEIAAQLFISPHTVAYHLRKVFAKLDITSRNQLGGVLGDELEAAALGPLTASR
jgi:DNA-binding CsgD family transcriptional regulator